MIKDGERVIRMMIVLLIITIEVSVTHNSFFLECFDVIRDVYLVQTLITIVDNHVQITCVGKSSNTLFQRREIEDTINEVTWTIAGGHSYNEGEEDTLSDSH